MSLQINNWRLFQTRFPALAQRLQKCPEDASLSLRPTKTKMPTLIVHDGGKQNALHHPDDPIAYCETLLRSIANLDAANHIILMGFGLGYLPLALLELRPNLKSLAILEPSASVFRAAMQTVDLAGLFNHPSIQFIIGHENQIVHAELMPRIIDFLSNPPLVIDTPPIAATFPAWAESAKSQIQALMRFGQSGLATKFKDGPMTMQNLIANLPQFAASPGINCAGDGFKGLPAIIVAAGPSLNKNIHLLKEAQDRFVIFSTDTVFERLLNEGVAPHFVVTVDPTELNPKHFPRDQYGSNSILLFDPEARPEIIAKFSSATFSNAMTHATDKHDFFDWLDSACGGKGKIPKGGMVSQAAFYIADYWKCNPIIFIGQDLALDPKTGSSHAERTAYRRTIQFNEQNKNIATVPLLNGETSQEPLFWVEGIDGEPVPTMQNFMVYIQMLTYDIAHANARVIDATEGGAKLPGAAIQTLRNVIDECNADSGAIAKAMDTLNKTMQSKTDSSKTETSKTKAIEEIKAILSQSEKKAQAGLKEIAGLKNASHETMQKKLHAYRNQTMSHPAADYLIEHTVPKQLFDFLKLPPANASPEEKRTHALGQCETVLRSVIQACEQLRSKLHAP